MIFNVVIIAPKPTPAPTPAPSKLKNKKTEFFQICSLNLKILIEIAPKPTPPITGAPTPDPGAPCNRNYSSILFYFVKRYLFTVYLSCDQCIEFDDTKPRQCDWCANPSVVGDGKCNEKVIFFLIFWFFEILN